MKSQYTGFPVWIILLICAGSFVLYAYQTGITGRTLKNGEGCTCHNPTPYPEVSVVISGPDTLTPGEQALYSVTITGGDLIRGGTNIAASNGVLAPFSDDLRFESDELTHVWPKLPDSGAVTFWFYYTAPLTQGTETLYANGNSVNYNGENTGDKWNFALNKTVTIVSPPPATFPLSVNVSNGWNMVSIPGLHPVNQNVTTWWINKDPGSGVFKFNSGYVPVTSVVPGTGYWMKHMGAQTYNTGDEWPDGILIVPHDAVAGNTGWNMIGGYEQIVPTAGLTTSPPGLITGNVFAYNPSGGYASAPNLVPGYGYWVRLTGPGLINIPTLPAGPGKNIAVPSVKDLGRIIITDNKGKSTILYATDGKADLSLYELPPVPPDGMFDVRFSSSRYAEDLSLQKEIDLRGVEYPVTVKPYNCGITISSSESSNIMLLNPGEEINISSPDNKLYISSLHSSPAEYSLEQNYPNPFNPSTTINFTLPEASQAVKLVIYNSLGQEAAVLVNNSLPAGSYNYNWNAENASSGIYIYKLTSGNITLSRKMILLK